jgi:hypothetical protein
MKTTRESPSFFTCQPLRQQRERERERESAREAREREDDGDEFGHTKASVPRTIALLEDDRRSRRAMFWVAIFLRAKFRQKRIFKFLNWKIK